MYPGFIVLFPCCRCSCCRALNVHKLPSLSLLSLSLSSLLFAPPVAALCSLPFGLETCKKAAHVFMQMPVRVCVCVCGCRLHFCYLQHEKDVAFLTLLRCNGDFCPTAVVCVSGNEPPPFDPMQQVHRNPSPPCIVHLIPCSWY